MNFKCKFLGKNEKAWLCVLNVYKIVGEDLIEYPTFLKFIIHLKKIN